MKKVPGNFVLNLIAFYLLVLLIATGLLMEFVLVPGSRGGHGLAVLGWTRHNWGDLHFYLSVGFIAAMLLHVILHWAWIRATFSRFLTAKSALTMVVVATTSILLIVSPFVVPLQRGVVEEGEGGGGQGRRGGGRVERAMTLEEGVAPQFKGYMTLLDVEQLSGMPAAQILKALNLPENTLANDRIGPMLRSHNMEMNDLRKVVFAHMGISYRPDH